MLCRGKRTTRTGVDSIGKEAIRLKGQQQKGEHESELRHDPAGGGGQIKRSLVKGQTKAAGGG